MQAGLQLEAVLLPLLPKCWHHSCAPPHPASWPLCFWDKVFLLHSSLFKCAVLPKMTLYLWSSSLGPPSVRVIVMCHYPGQSEFVISLDHGFCENSGSEVVIVMGPGAFRNDKSLFYSLWLGNREDNSKVSDLFTVSFCMRQLPGSAICWPDMEEQCISIRSISLCLTAFNTWSSSRRVTLFTFVHYITPSGILTEETCVL